MAHDGVKSPVHSPCPSGFKGVSAPPPPPAFPGEPDLANTNPTPPPSALNWLICRISPNFPQKVGIFLVDFGSSCEPRASSLWSRLSLCGAGGGCPPPLTRSTNLPLHQKNPPEVCSHLFPSQQCPVGSRVLTLLQAMMNSNQWMESGPTTQTVLQTACPMAWCHQQCERTTPLTRSSVFSPCPLSLFWPLAFHTCLEGPDPTH